MMKKIFALLFVGAAFASFCNLAQSMPIAPPPDGSHPLIPPVAGECQISVSNSNVDFGKKSRWQLLNVEGSAQLLTPGKRNIVFNAVCPFSRSMRITARGDSTTGGNFRFGKNDKLRVKLINAQLDGHDVQIMTSTPDGVLQEGPFTSLPLQPGQTFIIVNGHQPIEGKALSLRLELEPVLTEQNARVASMQSSEATLTLELHDQ